MRYLFFAISLLPLVACSTAISTMQPVQALPKGGLQFGTGAAVNVAPGPIVDAFQAGKVIAEKGVADINAQEEQDFLTAGLAIALNPPGIINEYSFRYGLGRGTELGLRYTINEVIAESKWQFLDNPEPKRWDAALHLSVGHHIFGGTVFDVLDQFKLADFSRNDISAAVMVGKKPNEYVEFWLGPKYVAGFYSVDGLFETTGTAANSKGAMQYFGGAAGIGLGWKYIYLIGELTVMDLIFKADILGQERDLGGLVVFPSVGLVLRVPTKQAAQQAKSL
jgi:hypothetical protein